MREQKLVRRMNCVDIESFVISGGDANSFETYPRADNGVSTTISLIERTVELGCANALHLLIDKGANLNRKTLWDFYLDVPLKHHRERLASLPIDNQEEIDGNSLLFLWSLFFQNVAVSHILYNTFIHHRDEAFKGKVMLASMSFAAEIGNTDLIYFLLSKGGEKFINSQEIFYSTPFHVACLNGELKIAKILFEHGANPNVATINSDVPLTSAIANDNEEVALWLIEIGAKVDIQLKDKSKPITMAKKHKLNRVVSAIQEKLN